MKMTHDEFMAQVGAKLNDAKASFMANGLRDARGYMETANRIKTSSENFFFSQGSECFDPVEACFSNFSERAGMGDVANVAAVDLVDLNIMATQQSVMPYLSAERAMDKPVDTAWYQGLVAVNTAGGFNKGDSVVSPFSPISPAINLGAAVATKTIASADITDPTSVDFETGKGLAKKNVTVTAYDASNAVIATGTDLKGNGVIYWDNGTACDTATVDYDTGVVTLKNVNTTDVASITVTANIDRSGERDGASTLKLKPETKTVTLVSKPNRVILENNYENNMFINKQAYNLSNIGVQMDFGKRAINQLLRAFIFYLDATSVNATYNAAMKQQASDTLDYTDYLLSTSMAETKNDVVNQYMLKLNSTLQKKTGFGPSYYLVDSEGANVLGNNPLYFSGNPSFDKNLDGLVGTYKGIPVIRHHNLNNILDDATNTYGLVIAGYKSADGQAACTMYGEYIPPYSVTPALNYDNPAQFSQALLSQSVTQELVPELCTYMKIVMS